MEQTGYWHMCDVCGKTEPVSLLDWQKAWTCNDCELKYGDIKLLNDLVREQKKEYLSTKIWERFWQTEYYHPKFIGKEKALENVSLMQKRLESIKNRIDMYEDYRINFKSYAELITK